MPVLALVAAAEQRAAEAHGQQLAVVEAQQPVQRGLGRLRDRLPGAAAIAGAVQATAFAGHQQAAVGEAEHGVEVQAFRVVEAGDIRPAAPAIAGVHDHPVGADRPAFGGVVEPHIQQRPRRSRRGAGLDVVEGEQRVVERAGQRLVVRRRRAGRLQARHLGLGPALHQGVEAVAVELLEPGRAAVGAVQDHAVVADGPALALVDEVHGGEQQVDRHRGLVHAAVGVAQEDVAAGADHHQPRAEPLQVGERRPHGAGRRLRGALQAVGQGRGEGGGAQRGDAQRTDAQAEQQPEHGAMGSLHGAFSGSEKEGRPGGAPRGGGVARVSVLRDAGRRG
ncbi:hypothetical protein D9M70_460990 [compost metagenome]